jgi:hypothetical protein
VTDARAILEPLALRAAAKHCDMALSNFKSDMVRRYSGDEFKQLRTDMAMLASGLSSAGAGGGGSSSSSSSSSK